MTKPFRVRFYLDLHIRDMIVWATTRQEARKIFHEYMDDIDGIGDIVQISEEK